MVPAMPRRSYDHYCGIARALDHLGERWALLIIRELLSGPRRYSDLLADLPGISTDVLAARLRELESDGLLTRAQGGLRTYELTEAGTAVAPVLDALSDWGLARLGHRTSGDAVRGHWLGAPLARRLGPLASGTDPLVVQVRLGETSFQLELAAGQARHVDGPAARHDVVLTTDPQTAAALAAGRTSLADAVGAGDAKVEGPAALVDRLLAQ
jgi:DNA-binding HxlR family transcriptional regulator